MSIQARRRRILISGASIAGPAAAYWLARYGFDVTLVEKAASLRGGGYPIDIRGAAMTAARRMGLGPALAAAHIRTRKLTFVDAQGQVSAVLNPNAVTGGLDGQDVELPRGELATLLYAATKDTIDYRFGQSIAALEDGPDGVAVSFADGRHENFDLVIGADGIHSNTRKLVFGREEQFTKRIGFCFAGFAMPNRFSLSHEGITWNAPGRMATLYAAGGQDYVHALLAFAHDGAPREAAEQHRLVREAFAGAGWHIPQMLAASEVAEDFYFDSIAQVRMPAWHSGRVVLVGDAAYGPSFLTGQGTSLALAGTYVLASEIARHDEVGAALAAYETRLRLFVELNQATVADGQMMMLPASTEQLEARNAALAAMPADAAAGEPAHDALDLGDYEALL